MTTDSSHPDPDEPQDSEDDGKPKRRKRDKDRGMSFHFRDAAGNVNINVGDNNRAGDRPGPKGGLTPLQKIASVATVVAAIIAVATFVLNRPSDASTPEPRESALTGTPAPNEPFKATITKTMDVDTDSFVGVIAYRDPTARGKGTDAAHYPEGGTIYVACQKPDGRRIEDKAWQDRLPSTTIWYRLSTSDPRWVPSMYVTVVDGRGAKALPTCA